MMHNPNRWRVNLLLLLGILAALLLVCVTTVVWRDYSQREKIYRTAEKLGHNPALEIAQVNRCWNIFSRCGLFLFYKTNLTQEEIARSVTALSWEVLYENEVDGYEIFTDINFGTNSHLTINGLDASGDRSQLPRFKGNRWDLRDPQGRNWTITYYPLADQSGSIALDGQALQQNVVAILYRTR